MILAKLKDQLAFTDSATSVDWPESAVWPLVSFVGRRLCHYVWLSAVMAVSESI
jgi:hypothetical protein